MKAKVKETGEVIEVHINKCAIPVQGCGASSIYLGDNGKTYLDTELDFLNVYPDWQQVRIQASIAAMQGILSNERRIANMKDTASSSVKLADALIEELKKKK